jgi:hypothetical protein
MPAAVMPVSGTRLADSSPRAMRASGVSVADSAQARYPSHSQSGTATTTNHHPGSLPVGTQAWAHYRWDTEAPAEAGG